MTEQGGIESRRHVQAEMADMSHQLRASLNGILGMTRLLLKSELSPEAREYARIARSSAESLSEHLDSLIELARADAGKQTPEAVDFDLVEALHAVRELLAPCAAAKGVELVLDLDDRLPSWLHGDPVLLRQILLHLGDNAVKFTDEGFVSVTAEPVPQGSDRADGEASWVRFAVRDTGIGIAADAQPALLESSEGPGRGLEKSRRIAEALGGRIEIKSKPGLGSLFSFTVPFRPAVAAEAPRARRDSRVWEGAMPARGRWRILVAEDDATCQLVTMKALEELGYPADAVANGHEALAALESRAYNLVLMDCQMPELDGYETTRQIRRRSGERHLPVIALTAHAMRGDREKCFAVGMDAFLPKPLHIPDLARLLDDHLAVQLDAAALRPVRTAEPAAAPAEPAAAPSCSRALDAKYVQPIMKLRGERSDDLFAELAESFSRRAPRLLEALKQAFRQGRVVDLADTAHTITGISGSIGAVRLGTLTRELEKVARKGDLAASGSRLRAVEKEYRRVETELDEIATGGWTPERNSLS